MASILMLSGHQGLAEEDAEGLWEGDAGFGHRDDEALDRQGKLRDGNWRTKWTQRHSQL